VKVHEYQAKQILQRAGIPIPDGRLATTPDEAESAAKAIGASVAVKAQVHAGGRGKAGGIKVAKSPSDAKAAATAILGMRTARWSWAPCPGMTRATGRRACFPLRTSAPG